MSVIDIRERLARIEEKQDMLLTNMSENYTKIEDRIAKHDERIGYLEDVKNYALGSLFVIGTAFMLLIGKVLGFLHFGDKS